MNRAIHRLRARVGGRDRGVAMIAVDNAITDWQSTG